MVQKQHRRRKTKPTVWSNLEHGFQSVRKRCGVCLIPMRGHKQETHGRNQPHRAAVYRRRDRRGACSTALPLSFLTQCRCMRVTPAAPVRTHNVCVFGCRLFVPLFPSQVPSSISACRLTTASPPSSSSPTARASRYGYNGLFGLRGDPRAQTSIK